MEEKLQILVVADEAPNSVWQAFAPRAEVTFVRDGREAKRILSDQPFHIIFLDIFLPGIDGLQLLRLLQAEESHSSVILTSEAPNFQFARQGLLYGACDYLLRPLQKENIEEALARIQRRQSVTDPLVAEIFPSVFKSLRSERFSDCMAGAIDRITEQYRDQMEAADSCRTLYQMLVKETYLAYPWLGQYLGRKECNDIDEIRASDVRLVQKTYLRQSEKLNALLSKLYPEVEEPFREIMTYMLTNVDSLYSQKEVAQAFFMSASSLSERFTSILHSSYREYHQLLRLYRAAYLMRSTNLKLYEICGKLGFKDTSYFSRQFKLQTGASIADYRQEGGWDFEI